METSFFAYIQQLELLAFFSGYPLLYAIVNVFAGKLKADIYKQGVTLLPLAYAIAGTLYVGLQLRNLYPNYSFQHIRLSIEHPWWTIWAVLSLLFWVPYFRKKPVLSLLHSLPFFFLLCRDLFFHANDAQQKIHVVRNDMKIYTNSFLLQLIAFTLVILLIYIGKKAKNR